MFVKQQLLLLQVKNIVDMKPESLFIGALVCVNRDGLCIRKGTIVEVRAVDADDKLIERGLVGVAHCRPLDDNQFEGGIWCEYLDPIPLTPEILEKNGFIEIIVHKDEPTRWVWDCEGKRGGVSVRITFYKRPVKGVRCLTRIGTESSKDAGINSVRSCDIDYVHELQRALRLCIIDKEIEL